jgi:ureidoacrylate peracid hydrolase
MAYLHHDDPSRMAILVIDVQPIFVGLPLYPPVDGVLRRLLAFIAQARSAGATIVNVRIAIPKELFSDLYVAQFSADFAQYISPDSPLTQFHPDFVPLSADLMLVKTRYSAFVGTQLESMLRMRGITTVAVAGLTADVCVGSTARDAFQRDFHVITLSDCTAEMTQATYEGCLATLRGNFGRVMTSDELLARWNIALAGQMQG